MDIRQLRLYIEHCALPELFFEHKEDLLAKIIREEGKVFADMFQRAVDIEYAGATSPYTEDDFKIVPMRMKDKRYSLHITLPEPEAPPECESIIMCYKISKKGLYDLHYFTIEKTEDGSALCEWTKNFLHITHGPLTPMGELMRGIQRGV